MDDEDADRNFVNILLLDTILYLAIFLGLVAIYFMQ